MPTYPIYKLGDVAKIYNGNSINAEEKEKKYKGVDGRNYIGTKDIDFDCSVNYNNGVRIPYGEEKFKIAPAGSVLVCAEGGSAGKKSAFITEDVCFGNKLFAITNNQGLFDGKYVFYYTRYKRFFDLFKNELSGLIGGVSSKKFGEIPIPLPPLPTQRAIVARIESLFAELDKAAEHLRTAQQQLKTYRQAVLNHWLNNDEGKWKMVKLGEVIEKPTYGTSKKCDYDIEGTGVLRIPNIGNGYIIDDDLKFAVFSDEEKEKYSLKEGDLLTIRSNGSVDLVGKCALVSSKEENYLFAGYLIRLRPMSSKVDSKYLIFTMESHYLRIQIEDKAKSTSGVNNINSVEIQNLVISLPSLTEQQRIVKEIESRLSQAEAAEASIAEALQKTEALRQSILKKAFSGELV